MEIISYEKEYKIPVFEIGANGKLNPHSLFNYLQDIASEHAVKLGFGKDDLVKQNHFWVLSRVTAHIAHWPGWEDKIIVRTWPRGADKLFALRDYEVLSSDGKVIVSATSSWLVVDITSRRVQRPDYIITRYNMGSGIKSAIGRNSDKLEPVPGNGKNSDPYKVRVSDLDVNLHTNNAMYIKWVSDSYDLEYRMKHLPSSVEVNYLAESRWGEEVTVKVQDDENNPLIKNHSVVRSVDNTELCRIRINWK